MCVFLPFILSVNGSLDDLDPGLSQGPAGTELTAGLKTHIYHDQTQTWCLWAPVCFPGRLILAADALSRNLHGKLLQEWWLAEPDRAARGGWWCQREGHCGVPSTSPTMSHQHTFPQLLLAYPCLRMMMPPSWVGFCPLVNAASLADSSAPISVPGWVLILLRTGYLEVG